jgi:hypothetical protein
LQLGVEERALEKKQHALQEKSSTLTIATPTWRSGSGHFRSRSSSPRCRIVAAATWLLGGGVLAGVIGLAYVAYAAAVT